MSPLPPIIHILAVAAGLWGTFALMPGIAPDLPSAEPGVLEAEESQIDGPEDPDSLFHPGPYGIAISQLGDQLGDDEQIRVLHVLPAELDVETTESGGVSIDEVSTSAPYLMAYQIGEHRKANLERDDVKGVEDLTQLSMVATPEGPIWNASIDPSLPPPHAYRALIRPGDVAFQVKVRPIPGF